MLLCENPLLDKKGFSAHIATLVDLKVDPQKLSKKRMVYNVGRGLLPPLWFPDPIIACRGCPKQTLPDRYSGCGVDITATVSVV